MLAGATAGGKGGYAVGEYVPSAGQVLNIFVGGMLTGFNGGGGKRSGTSSNTNGGGASDVRVGGSALANRIIVAGGGGGGYGNAETWGKGGDGGGLTGADGAFNYIKATGGTQSNGGQGGSNANGTGSDGLPGTLGVGGASGTQGGGGGGGYYGGGGGNVGGGGGGSSYIGTLTNASTTPGLRSGDGLVVITLFNTPPTLTLTSPANNQTLTEGKTLIISGSATDADSGNVVTVKYKINNGTTYNITASVSNGTTPINFSKTLTYVNNRLYDGSNPVTPILAENVTHTLTVWAEDDQGGKSPDTTRNFTVLYNQPPQISGSDQDLGTITTPPSIQYTVTDVEGYSFTITEAVDGTTIRSFPGTDGKQETLTIPHDMWIKLQPGVTHQLTITATDQYNASSKRTYTFKRAVDGIELATTAILPADAQPTRVILSLNGTIPDGANLNVQVCNNAHDVSPTWEDMSQSVKNGRPYVFTNTTSTSGQWGIRFKINILPGG